MAGNYRSQGSNIVNKVSRLASAVRNVKNVPKKKAYMEQERRKSMIDKVVTASTIHSNKEKQKRRTITHAGKVQVRTEQAKQVARTEGVKARKAVNKKRGARK